MPSDVTDWSLRTGHVVVCGLHDDGLRMVEQLHGAGVPALVVDDEPGPGLERALQAVGVPLLAADSRSAQTLRAAGIGGAVAIVCAESDDLHTLATALLARELESEVRIVVALRNDAVGRALEGVGVRVLDAAALAAPTMVEACLSTQVHEVRLGEAAFVVTEVEVSAPGTLRELYGDLAPLALTTTAGDRLISPGRDERVGPGDRVALIGAADDVRRAGLLPRRGRRSDPAFVGARAPRERQRSSVLLHLWRTTDRRLKTAVGALLTLTVVSVAMLTVGYQEPSGRRMSLVDALYFTVETVGTVGYGDFYFRDQPLWLRLWAIALMMIGATLATVFFALLTNALISRTIAQTLGTRRATGLRDHVVVVGAGAVGVAVVERLRREGIEVVVVEADAGNRFLGQLRAQHVPVVNADATLPSTWSAVRLGEARAVAVMTSSDLVNIETALAVRDLLGTRWLDVPVVLRLFDGRLERTVSSSFDFRHVRSPAALAAPWFVGAALGLDVRQTFYVGGAPVLVARMDVGADLAGTPVRDLSARLRVVSLERADGTVEHLPRRDATLAEGDSAHLIGPYEDLLRLLS